MRKMLARYKPGVSVRTHLLVASLIWSVVGFFLMINGFLFLRLADRSWLAGPALLIGAVKAFFIMDRVARKNLVRIDGFHDGACIGSVYSWKTWGLVLLMIVMGRFLRNSGLAGEFVGVLYLAVGWALFWASRLIWQAWHQRER